MDGYCYALVNHASKPKQIYRNLDVEFLSVKNETM